MVALTTAIQSQGISPLTAIDEFEQGLDQSAKDALIRFIPKMVEARMAETQVNQTGPVQDQFLVVVPEIEPTSISDGINFMTIVRSGYLSQIES